MALWEEEKSHKGVVLASAISLPEPGGVSNYVDVLSKEPFVSKVITFNFKDPFNSFKQSKFYYLKRIYAKSTKLSFFLRILIMSYFLRKSKGAIYAMDASISGLAAFLSGRKYFIRWVGDFSYESYYTHKIFAETLEEYLKRRKDWKYYLQKVVLMRASAIIVPSLYLRKILIHYYHIPPKNIYVISNFSFFSNREALKRKPKTLVFVGRMTALKQPHFMLYLAMSFRNKLNVYFIGAGPLESILIKFIKKFRLNNAKFLGYKSKREMRKYLKDALAVVIPSVYEGQSFTALEMQSLGIPVIMRNLEANQELLGSKYACFFDDLRKCKELIKELLSGSLLCTYNVNWENYSYRKHVKKLKEVLKVF